MQGRMTFEPHRRARNAVVPRSVLGAFWVGPLLIVLGCHGRAPESPRASAERFAKATQRGDAEAVHGMLTAEGRAKYSVVQVQALLKDGRAELSQMSEQILRDSGQCRLGKARLRLRDNGAELWFAEQADGYRFSGGRGTALTFGMGAESPELLLVEFGHALESLDLPRILSLLSSDKKKEIVGHLERLARELRHSALGHVETTATGYVVTLGDGTRLQLVAEPEGYRIVHIQ
jgi:hypothetical protein